MLSGKKIFILFFLCFALIVASVFYFLTAPPEPAAPPSGGTDVKDIVGDIGIQNIRTLPAPAFPTPDLFTDPASGRRDDRIRVHTQPGETETGDTVAYTPPGDGAVGDAADAEEIPARLTRIFVGPTAGYRIDKDEDGVWVVRIVEQGRGDRYIVRTVPYALNLVSAGEFTRVFEGLLFSSGTVLMRYEDPRNESGSRSAFVSFAPTGSSVIQNFEDTIRTATNNENLLFFTKQVEDEVLGIVVDVENPEETDIVWRSHFRNWIPRWGRGSRITLSAPISRFTNGYVYLVDPSGEEPTTRLADIPSGGSAFVDTSSGFFVLYEASDRSLVGETTVTEQTRKTSVSVPSTLPEKCDGFNGVFVCAVPHAVPALTRSGYETVFPDSWYQGDIVLRDAVMQVDAVTGEKTLVMSSDQEDIRTLSGGKDFDIIHPRISEDGRFLFFVDKNDLSLWMLRL